MTMIQMMRRYIEAHMLKKVILMICGMMLLLMEIILIENNIRLVIYIYFIYINYMYLRYVFVKVENEIKKLFLIL